MDLNSNFWRGEPTVYLWEKVFSPFHPQDLISNSPHWLCCTIHLMLGEFCIGSTDNPSIDICLYSHHLSAWYCIDIVRRNSVLVNHGRVKLIMVIFLSYLQEIHGKRQAFIPFFFFLFSQIADFSPGLKETFLQQYKTYSVKKVGITLFNQKLLFFFFWDD